MHVDDVENSIYIFHAYINNIIDAYSHNDIIWH